MNEEIYTCDRCGDGGTGFPISVVVAVSEEEGWCRDCVLATNVATCDVCRSAAENWSSTVHGYEVCATCLSRSNWHECEVCGEYWDDDRWDQCCEVSPEHDEYDEDCGCEQCQAVGNYVHNYSFQPSPRFLSVGPERRVVDNQDRTLYMGFELELNATDDNLLSASRMVYQAVGDTAYLKSDSSIGYGFELVTHPMTLDYAMQQFNWDAIRKARAADLIRAGSSCGLHVHVSKAAFASHAHELRWLMFWYRNQQIMTALARRTSNDYASFKDRGRPHLAKIAKRESPDSGHARYVAINAINEHTYEVRIFASSVYVNRIKAALQLVESTVRYTENLAVSKVMSDGGFSFGQFMAWVNGPENTGQYVQLNQQVATLVRPELLDATQRTDMSITERVPTGGFDMWGSPRNEARFTVRSFVTQERF